ncbi:MAG: class I SAM-dependent methyltransferase, partial [Thermoleophilaceae bacterium]
MAPANQEVGMDSQTVDAVEFRDGQRQQWQKGAKGWRERSDFIDAATAPVSKRMMLLYGRERAAAAGLENVEFVESEAAGLDFPAESFDAALSRFGIIFEPEAEATAGRVRGFLVPGSRMVISSWAAGARAVHRGSDGHGDAHSRRRSAPARNARAAVAPDAGGPWRTAG